MSEINFKSYVKYCGSNEFAREINSIGKKFSVDYPWTIGDRKIGRSAYTKNIQDCTILGVTDGIKVLLLHLCPTDKTNWNKKKILSLIKENFDIASGYVQGFLLGSKPNSKNSPKSKEFFDYVKSVPDELKIPYSAFRGGYYIHDVAYNGDKDTWFISNELMRNGAFREMSPKAKTNYLFDESVLAETDEYVG